MTFSRTPPTPKRFLSHTTITDGPDGSPVTDLVISVGFETITLHEDDARAYLAYLQEKFA